MFYGYKKGQAFYHSRGILNLAQRNVVDVTQSSFFNYGIVNVDLEKEKLFFHANEDLSLN